MSPVVRIPGIEIGDELGRGAYSVVYRARQGDALCALKVPLVRGRWTRWAYREAVALARVRHPGLPRVLEVGEVDGLPYLLMELLEGETLAQRLRSGPLALQQALEIGSRLADTLRAVHEVGLVHRDVKPGNIMLEASGGARLVDFGFAAPVGSAAARDAAGTRLYSAPEQFRTPERVDGRADLYALGRVLFECLVGRGAEGDSTRVVLDLTSAGVPAPVARIVRELVAENPDDRYPDATAVLGELHRVRAGMAPLGAAACEPTRAEGALVGRDNELDRFVRTWRQVGASGGRVFLVEGIRGSGKTRFLRACNAQVRTEGRGRSLQTACREGDAPLAAVRRIIERYLASLARLPPPERAAVTTALRASASGPLASLACAITPAFSETLGLPATHVSTAPEAFAEGAAELIVRMARQAGPFVLTFDDFHWIDPLSREVVGALADRAHEAPLLLVVAARPAAARGTFARFDTVESARAVRLSLGPLELRQSADLIASHLGVAKVHPLVARRVVAMADDTPLGVLEVLGAFLDAGALRLRTDTWELNETNVGRVGLPTGALAFLGRRTSELPLPVRRILEVAAVLGSRFDDSLLAEVAQVGHGEIEHALGMGRRAGLLEQIDRRSHGFTHETVREMLIAGLEEDARRRTHQRAAEILSDGPQSDPEVLYACARHFAAGQPEVNADLAHRAARKAGDAALDRFDNETALWFFDLARTRADAAGLPLDVMFHRRVGEANLRIGALEESLRSFESALGLAEDAPARAAILSRIAWVQRARSQPEQAWVALDQAFAALGVRMGTEDNAPASRPPEGSQAAPQGTEALDVLYELHHQSARLGIESGKPLRTMRSTMQVLALAGAAGPSVALARAQATYGAVLVFTGKRAVGNRRLTLAQAMATKLGDTATTTFCLQRRFMALAFTGDFDGASKLLRECADDYGPWFEVNEYVGNVLTGDFIESVRGRPAEGWKWIVRARDRLRRQRGTSAAFAHHFLYRARATLASLGRSGSEDPWLIAQLESVGKAGPERFFDRMSSWGPRARYLLDTGDLDSALEDLVHEVRAGGGADPKAAHPAVMEYFIGIAHARIQQCLRASPDERPGRLAALRLAASDLRVSAKLPIYSSHSLLADGYVAWLEGDIPKARRFLAKAEPLAVRENCPWVLFGVARARAHMLRERGDIDSARDQARIAEVLAVTHGAEPRARWIREEFSLPAPEASPLANSLATSGHRSSRRVKRQLVSLLHIVRAPYSQLQPTQQGAAIVDDLVRELGAERAYLLFEPAEDPRGRLLVGRSRLGETLPPPEAWREELMRQARDNGDSWDAGQEAERMPSREGPPDAARALAVPLFLHDKVVGAVCIERGSLDPALGPDDHEMLLVLCHQVPLALELTRLLRERDQLQTSIQQVQKMEVVGQLAGSVAHDFNNMLQGIEMALDILDQNRSLDDAARAETGMIYDSVGRASQLTRKLLAFSRQQPLPLASTNLNQAITSVEKLIVRLMAKTAKVDLILDLPSGVHSVLTDEASFEQAIVNLAVNARDAMPRGGTLRISTRNVELGSEDVRQGAPAAGEYVAVEVSDTGEGMPPEVLARIFDPFFTTKAVGKGTGLGLTTVYTFVKKSGGHIGVSSDVGRGTTFRLYLPKAEEVRVERPASLPPPSIRPGTVPAMILVVDDDPIVCEATRAQLQEGGYRVTTASGPADALRFMELHSAEISLVILDVQLPEMSGPELRRRFTDLHVPAKVLFITGHAAASLPELTDDKLLTKPFSRTDLLGQVRKLLS